MGTSVHVNSADALPFETAPRALPYQHQQRVVAEKAELDDRLGKLQAFFQGPIFPTLPEAERALLRCQALFMTGYSAVLGDRIQAFKAP